MPQQFAQQVLAAQASGPDQHRGQHGRRTDLLARLQAHMRVFHAGPCVDAAVRIVRLERCGPLAGPADADHEARVTGRARLKNGSVVSDERPPKEARSTRVARAQENCSRGLKVGDVRARLPSA